MGWLDAAKEQINTLNHRHVENIGNSGGWSRKMASSRLAWATWWYPVSKKKKNTRSLLFAHGSVGWEVRGWAAAAGEDLLAEGLCRVPRWCQHHAVSEAASIMRWVKPSVLAQICPCGIRASPLWPHLVIFQRPHLQIPGKIKFPPS